MRRTTCIAVAAILASCGTAHAGPVLLASIDRVNGSGSTGLTDPRAQLGISVFPNDVSPDPITLDMILFSDSFLEDGESGVFDFDATNSELFLPFADLLTNGVDNLMGLFTVWPEIGQGGIRGDFESFFFDRDLSLSQPPDLAGYDLDLIRLIIRDVAIEPFSVQGQDGLMATFDYTYEFYGTPIPEPSTLVLLAVGAAAVLRRHRTGVRYKGD